MISDWMTKYTQERTCAHLNNTKDHDYHQVILVHVVNTLIHTSETCDDSIFKIGGQ